MERLADHVEDPREGQLTTRPPQGRCPGSAGGCQAQPSGRLGTRGHRSAAHTPDMPAYTLETPVIVAHGRLIGDTFDAACHDHNRIHGGFRLTSSRATPLTNKEMP
jgi:hypothetical protein